MPEPPPIPGDVTPWVALDSEELLSRPPWFTVVRDSVRLPGGRVLDDFYRVLLSDYVVVAAVTVAGEFVMARTYKHGLGRVSLTAPAGHIDPGEVPLEAARRELLEETGYEAAEWHLLGSFLTDGNRHCGTGHVFLARGATRVAEPHDHDAEEVRVELLAPDQFGEALRSGRIALLPTATALGLALAFGLGGAKAENGEKRV